MSMMMMPSVDDDNVADDVDVTDDFEEEQEQQQEQEQQEDEEESRDFRHDRNKRRKQRSSTSSTGRVICPRCHRPSPRTCLCPALPSQQNLILLRHCHCVVLQHPLELKRKDRSLIFLELCLHPDDLTVIVDRELKLPLLEKETLRRLMDPKTPTWLVFPDPEAIPLSQAIQDLWTKENENLDSHTYLDDTNHDDEDDTNHNSTPDNTTTTKKKLVTLLFLDATWHYVKEMNASIRRRMTMASDDVVTDQPRQDHYDFWKNMIRVQLDDSDFAPLVGCVSGDATATDTTTGEDDDDHHHHTGGSCTNAYRQQQQQHAQHNIIGSRTDTDAAACTTAPTNTATGSSTSNSTTAAAASPSSSSVFGIAQSGRYQVLRKPPSPRHLSTCECIAYCLARVEGLSDLYATLCKPLDLAVQQWHDIRQTTTTKPKRISRKYKKQQQQEQQKEEEQKRQEEVPPPAPSPFSPAW